MLFVADKDTEFITPGDSDAPGDNDTVMLPVMGVLLGAYCHPNAPDMPSQSQLMFNVSLV
jgi:hypothetical protein